jgi:hypothetical protein
MKTEVVHKNHSSKWNIAAAENSIHVTVQRSNHLVLITPKNVYCGEHKI